MEKSASTTEAFIAIVQQGLEARKVGNSDVHEHSSRSHALLEVEVVTRTLLDARGVVADFHGRVTKVGHEKDVLEMDIHFRTHIKVNGKWEMKPDAVGCTDEECQTIARLSKEKTTLEKQLKCAEQDVLSIMQGSSDTIGGTLGTFFAAK